MDICTNCGVETPQVTTRMWSSQYGEALLPGEKLCRSCVYKLTQKIEKDMQKCQDAQSSIRQETEFIVYHQQPKTYKLIPTKDSIT